ncbi:sulfotransferase [Myxococcota bacterium]|nr:sulfotransferase [Myxococcota bacterium]
MTDKTDKRKGVDTPIFLVGAERSGTTLFRLMLDNHPELAFQHEFELAVDELPEEGGWPDLYAFHEYLRTYRFASFTYEIDKTLDYPSLIYSMLEQKRTRSGKPLLGATIHRHFDRILRLWPNATFIKLLRDGRDVARSNIGMGWAGNVWFGVERWIQEENDWREMERIVSEDRRITVRYEELIANPVEQLTRVCKWIGIEYSPQMLEYMHTESGKNYKYPDPKLSYQWKKKLSEREIQLLESRIADMLVERGYELSGLPRITPSAAELAKLRVDNRIGKIRYRFDTLGPRLWAEDIVSRRVGPQTWRDKVVFKVNDVINQNLD